MKRRNLLLLNSSAALLAAGLYLALNLISCNLNFRLDMTRGGLYSVNTATKKVLAGLDAPAVLTLYASRDLPPQVAVIDDYLRNMLREYEAIGKGKVKVRIIEAANDDAVAKEALERGIQPVVFDIFEKEKYEQREGFFGLAVQYKDKTERIPFIADAGNLEYDITSRINLLQKGITKRLGFVTAGEAKSFNRLDPEFVKHIRTRFDITEVELTPEQKDLPDVLVLLGPSAKFTDAQLYALDRYIAGGGAVFCAPDVLDVNLPAFVATPIAETGLTTLLEHYGVLVSSGLVMDKQSQPIEVARKHNGAMMRNIVQYYPLVSAANLNRQFPPVSGLDSLFLPFTAPLMITTNSGTRTILALSSPDSWVKAASQGPKQKNRNIALVLEVVNLNPFDPFIKEVPAKPTGPYALAVFLERAFTPFYQAPPKGVTAQEPLVSKPGRMIVTGTSRFIVSDFRMPDSNYIFFMNCAEWLAQSDSLIAIRSKTADFTPITELPAGKKSLIKYANITLPPLLAVLAGLVIWRLNLRRRARNRKMFGTK